jgi:localization factor PodJL
MQPELPWNVAGIPPEAREAARAAARREGLSVGEWLTRRILKSFGDLGSETPDTGAARESWRANNASPYRVPTVDQVATPAQDSEDMLARVARAENESQGVNKRTEDQMRALTRRLDATERSQSENGRAMSKAAAEINVAAREQAQAFDQLGSHVVGLTERLARVERSASTDGVRDAVKALHQGLSRLADQISETANQSATQIASLANNVESVAGRLSDARGEAEHTSRSLEQRIAVIDERVRAVERAAHASANALEKTIETIEASHASKAGELGEIQRQGTALAQLSETIDRLGARLTTSEAQNAGAMARLEENVAKLEARGAEGGIDRRLHGIEQTLSDIAGRLESTERKSVGADYVEENMRSLASRVDAADKRHRDALSELRAAVKEAGGTLEPDATPAALAPIIPVAPAPLAPAPQTPPPFAAAPAFDLPPFPEQHGFQPAADAFAPPPFDTPFAPDTGRAFGADAFAAAAAQQAGAAGNESYLDAARRSARAAAAAQAEQAGKSPFAGFSWGFANKAQPAAAQKSGGARFLLIGGIALLVFIAVIAGVFLSHSLGTNAAHAPANLPPMFQARPGSTPDGSASPATQSPPATQYVPPATTGSGDDESQAPVNDNPHGRVVPEATSSPKIAEHPLPKAPATAATPKPAAQTPQVQQTPLQRLAVIANSGSPKAELLLGLAYLDGQGTTVNEAEAARWLERAAIQGDALAQYRLGTLYERGRGVPADATKAIQLYAAAAKLGNRKAMHNLAVALAGGNGVKKDLAQAAQWFTRAAELGLSDSQFNLAVLYERGMGVPQSLTDAYKWYAIAAAQGDTESKTRIDALATQLGADDKAAAQRAADSFKPQPMDRAANNPPDLSAVLGG